MTQTIEERKAMKSRLRKAHYAKHREHELAMSHQYYEERADEIRERAAIRHARRQAVDSEYRRRAVERSGERRARERLAAAVEQVDRRLVWERDEGVCRLCGKPANPTDWHLDHLIPLIKGGAHTTANVAVSHPRCNNSKGIKDPRVNLRWGFLLLVIHENTGYEL